MSCTQSPATIYKHSISHPPLPWHNYHKKQEIFSNLFKWWFQYQKPKTEDTACHSWLLFQYAVKKKTQQRGRKMDCTRMPYHHSTDLLSTSFNITILRIKKQNGKTEEKHSIAMKTMDRIYTIFLSMSS